MPKSMPVALLAGCLACLALPASTDAAAPALPLPQVAPVAEGLSPARLQRLHAFLQSQSAANGYLGGVVLVARHGRLVDWHAFGHRDLARTQPVQRDDLFRIYSMTKPITSVALAMLVEDGTVSIDDPVSRWLPALGGLRVLESMKDGVPQWRAPRRPITLRHLATHTAGFPAGLEGDDAAQQWTDRDDPHGAADLAGFVERLSRGALAADPGTRFGYEAANTEALARVVEVASGQDFETFVRTRIFTPLGMRDTGFSVPAAQRGRVVDITRMGAGGQLVRDDGPSARVPGERLNAYASGAGGLYSSAADYARFCQMLLNGGTFEGHTLLGRKTVEWMLSNQLDGVLDPPVNQYSAGEGFGLGGYVVLDPARRGQPGSVGQFGWSGAASTNFLIDPREGLSVILLLQHLPNGAANDLPRIGRRVQALAISALVP